MARGTLYLRRKQAGKVKQVATAIEQWHEQDDTMGHRKLAALLKTGKNRVKRVMKKYGIQARRKKKRSVYPGKASSIVPNALRDPQTPAETEVMFSDSFAHSAC
jgi:putative transposase